MTKPPTLPTYTCASEILIRLLKGRWAPSLVMVVGQRGPIHFSAIAREVQGISVKVLTEQLRDLVESGVFNRIANENRPEVYYELTPRGLELKLALDSLNDLADRWPHL